MFGDGGEVFEQWDDWYNPKYEYPPPAFTDEERQAVAKFHSTIGLAADRTSFSPSIDEVRNSPDWPDVLKVAQSALGVFMERGTLSEEQELL